MKSNSYNTNNQPAWVDSLALGVRAGVDAYLAHHKGWATDLDKDRHSVLSIRSNVGLFLDGKRACLFTDLLLAILAGRGTHRVVLIGKVKYLEPVNFVKPFIQPGLHSFSQGPNFFQPSTVS